MKLKVIAFLVGVLMCLGSVSYAAEDKAAAKAAAMDPKMQAHMEEVQKKYMTPNENHKALQPTIGKWKATVKFWMTPDSPAEVSEGTLDSRWIMGGRFVQQDFKGTAMGKPFEGMGIVGYDSLKGEYTSIWLDSMATGIMVAHGQMDTSTKTLTQTGTMSCPMTMEKDRPMRSVWKILDNDRNVYESYMNDKDGKEFRAMEIVYERVK